MHLFLSLSLAEKRDLVKARQRARHVAALLRFSTADQLAVAAGAFVVAERALQSAQRCQLCFALDDVNGSPVLNIFCQSVRGRALEGPTLLRLVHSLPQAARQQTLAELAFVLGKLPGPKASRIFDEMTGMNQEILTLLHSLQSSQQELMELKRRLGNPNAA